MKFHTVLLLVLFSFTNSVNSANILALFNIPSPSIHLWQRPLLVALADRGHNVTVLSTMADKKPVPNVTDMVLEGIYEFIHKNEEYVPEEMSDRSPYSVVNLFMNLIVDICKYSAEHQAVQTLLNYPQDFKFDLILFEATSGECLLGVAKRFGSPPIVSVNSFSHAQWVNYMTDNPDHPAYTSHLFLPYTDRMSFLQRLDNFLINLFVGYRYRFNVLPALDAAARDNFGVAAAVPSQELRRVSVVMVNTHPAFDYPRPLLPSMINIAGIQIKEPQPLPQDLQQFLDEAKQGVIFFSLGTNVRSDKLKEDKRKALLEAFAEIQEKVLWKWESDSLPGQPKNVKVGKWFPQKDILAHPNVRLFITHSGLLSTQEAIHRGVPIVGIPFFADQQVNIHKAEAHGVGLQLKYKDITKETALRTIRRVLDDRSYSRKMKELSRRFRDSPDTPMQRALYWCEYVMRHKGAPHLRSAALDLTWYQYLLLDVIAALLVALLTPIILMWYCCRRLLCKKRSTDRLKKH